MTLVVHSTAEFGSSARHPDVPGSSPHGGGATCFTDQPPRIWRRAPTGLPHRDRRGGAGRVLPLGSWPVDRGDHDCAVLVGPAVRRVAVPERTSHRRDATGDPGPLNGAGAVLSPAAGRPLRRQRLRAHDDHAATGVHRPDAGAPRRRLHADHRRRAIDHLQFGTALPPRPVLLTFDDGSATHHSVALPVLTGLGFPATFFPMTVVLNKSDWLSEDELRDLDRAGMTIGAHTWDHQRVDRLAGDQWRTQLDQPKARLAEVLGHPVDLLAYPFGVWSQQALAQVNATGYRAAFQLSDPQDTAQPLLTIRRIMPPPTWDGPTLQGHLESTF